MPVLVYDENIAMRGFLRIATLVHLTMAIYVAESSGSLPDSVFVLTTPAGIPTKMVLIPDSPLKNGYG